MTHNNKITTTKNTKKGGVHAMTNENFSKVKEIAIVFLEAEIQTRELPLGNGQVHTCIDHPFFDNRIVYFAEEDSANQFCDILSSDAAMQKAVQRYRKFIEKAESIDTILLLITKPYRLQFLETIQKSVSPEEMGALLADIWVSSESPNADAVPLRILIKWFKAADKNSLMNAEELACYNSLPDEFQVYRGIGSKSNKKGISYTLSLEKAEWFANRFQKRGGYVLTGTAKKKDVLAYFNGRQEQEILIEPKNIADLHKM